MNDQELDHLAAYVKACINSKMSNGDKYHNIIEQIRCEFGWMCGIVNAAQEVETQYYGLTNRFN